MFRLRSPTETKNLVSDHQKQSAFKFSLVLLTKGYKSYSFLDIKKLSSEEENKKVTTTREINMAVEIKKRDVYSITCENPEKLQSKEAQDFNKEMLRFKIVFFLHNGGLGAALAYIPVYAKEELGLSATSLGAILTAQMFLFVFTKPLISYIADYFNQLKLAICILSLLSMTCFFSLLAIPKAEPRKTGNLSALLTEKDFNTTDACSECRDFLQFSHISNNFSLTESTKLIKVQFPNEACMSCFLGSDNCLNTSDGFFTTNISEIRTLYLDRLIGKEQQCLSCNQKHSFYSNICSCHHNFCQNSSNCEELFCLQNLESYETDQFPKSISLFRCSLTTNDSQKMYISCNAQNISASNLIDTKVFEQKITSDFQTIQFWLFALLFTVSNICENANFTLVDTACCESIQKTNGDFGKLRLWGNIGWGLITPIGGLLNDYTGGYISAWILMAIMLFLFMWHITQLDLVKPHFSQNILSDIGTIFRSKEFLAFELVNLMNGVGIGIIWFYLIWFLTTLGGSKFLGGLTIAVESFLGAIPCMFFSGWLIRKIGHYQILSAALLVYGLRFLFFSYLYDPWWVLPVEISHGITYGLYYTVIASYGKLSSKPGTEATTQSILFTTHEGLGAGLGCVFAGMGFDYFGTHLTFFFISIYFGIDFIISLLLYFFVIRKK
ncbi:Major facilitator superfamily domain-containing protein 6-A [Araneus ventricosus]|uniref:Major facilitator superfamily domain-containing protein 6-A n=1 Tax=Araneus ventricosus TaxID=182803 RepID=A0A4Y2LF62_ARAVE|nr:Major facilitator superfamily domain-containing protein 6-A [Araneus ventricosus]